MPEFMLHAWVAGTAVAVVCGPLGCFVVWRRMSYFGAAIAHSALLGVAMSLLLGGALLGAAEGGAARNIGRFLLDDPWPMVLLVSLIVAVVLLLLQRRRVLSQDTLLGIVAHGSLAAGLLIVAAMETLRIDVMAWLFGDILGLSRADVWGFALAASAALGVLLWQWRPLLSSTVNADIAMVEGVNTAKTELIFVLLLACIVALGLRVVGALLIISMLIIPPAAARRLAKTPRHMAAFATLIGVLGVCSGLALSWFANLPAGPSIVAILMTLFLAAMALPEQRGRGANKGAA